MLEITRKFFERIISIRLEAVIQQVGGLCDNQFGFRKGQSMIDAINRVVLVAKYAVSDSRCTKRMCAIIGSDIRNAFNTARWDEIILALEGLRVPLYLRRVILSYLTDRTLLYDTHDVRILIRSQEVCHSAQYWDLQSGTSRTTDCLGNDSQMGYRL